MSFVEALKNRRTIYAINRNTEVANDEIIALIKEAVR